MKRPTTTRFTSDADATAALTAASGGGVGAIGTLALAAGLYAGAVYLNWRGDQERYGKTPERPRRGP